MFMNMDRRLQLVVRGLLGRSTGPKSKSHQNFCSITIDEQNFETFVNAVSYKVVNLIQVRIRDIWSRAELMSL